MVGTKVLSAEGRCDIEPIEREMPHHIGGDSESMHSAAANCN